MAGIYAFLALIGGSLAAATTADQGVLPALLAALVCSNLLALLAAFLVPAAQPVIARKRHR